MNVRPAYADDEGGGRLTPSCCYLFGSGLGWDFQHLTALAAAVFKLRTFLTASGNARVDRRESRVMPLL